MEEHARDALPDTGELKPNRSKVASIPWAEADDKKLTSLVQNMVSRPCVLEFDAGCGFADGTAVWVCENFADPAGRQGLDRLVSDREPNARSQLATMSRAFLEPPRRKYPQVALYRR